MPGLTVSRRRGEVVEITWDGLQTEPERKSQHELEGGEVVVPRHYRIAITVVDISPSRIMLNIEAPRDVRLLRGELNGGKGHGKSWPWHR